MFDFQDYQNGIYCLDSGYIRPELAAVYFIVHQQRVAIIDTGSNQSIANIHSALQRLQLDWEAVDYIILTHIHLDHAGGASALMQLCPNAQLVVHTRGARHMQEPSKLIAGVSAVYGADYVRTVYGEILPIDGTRIISAQEGTEIDLAGRRLRCLDTAGHARHHICIWDEHARAVFTGDTFGLSYRELDTDGRAFIFPTTTPTQFEPEAMHESIDRIEQLQAHAIYPTHYARVEHVASLATELKKHLSAVVQMGAFIQSLNLPTAERHEKLKQTLTDYLLMQVTAFGCVLPHERVLEIFATDLELNAQGMGVWLDNQA